MPQLLTSIASAASDSINKQYKDNFSNQGAAARQEEREDRRLRAEKRNAEMRTLDQEEQLADQTFSVEKQRLDLLEQQNNLAMAENARQSTYNAFDRFTGDGDVRHLNTMLQDLRKNPAGQALFGEIARVDGVSESDRDLLAQNGIDADLVLSNPDLASEVVIATHANGKRTVEYMPELYKMTGYHRYASDREIERQRKAMEVTRGFRDFGYRTADERQAHREAMQVGEPGTPEYDEAFNAAYTRITARDDTSRQGTRIEREAARLARAEGYEEGSDEYEEAYNNHYANIVTRERETSASKNLSSAEDAKTSINDAVANIEGVDSFFDIDFSQRENRLQFEDAINRIEKLGDLELSTQDQKDLSYIKQLIAIGEPASEITAEETGIIDRFSRGIKYYLTDEVDGIDSTSAFAAYRNIVRNALYGSALTEAEMKAFNQQFGNLGQQTGPVLAQFRTALTQLQSKLESILALNDSYVTHFRVGVDQDDLLRIIDSVDERLEMFDRLERQAGTSSGGRRAPPTPQDDQFTPEQLEELGGIFEGGQQ